MVVESLTQIVGGLVRSWQPNKSWSLTTWTSRLFINLSMLVTEAPQVSRSEDGTAALCLRHRRCVLKSSTSRNTGSESVGEVRMNLNSIMLEEKIWTTLPSRTDATGCIPKMLIHVNHLCWAKWQRHCTVLRHLVAMRDVEVITGSVKLFTSDAQVRLWIIPHDMFGLFRVWIFPVLPRRSCTFIALSKFQTLQIGLHGFLIWTPTTSTCESSGAQPAPSNMQIRIERWTCLIQTILSTFLHHVCVDACRWPVAVADSAEGLWRLWRDQRN